MKKKVLGLDIDGILANNLEPFLKFIGYHYKEEFDLSQITNPSISVSLNLPKSEIISLFNQFENKVVNGEIVLEPLFDLAIVNKLNKNYEIDIITKREKASKDYTISWLSKHSVNFRDIYMLEDLYHGKKSSIECDVYIDDDPRNLYELWVSTDKKLICTVNNSYNKEFIKNMEHFQNGYFVNFDSFEKFIEMLA